MERREWERKRGGRRRRRMRHKKDKKRKEKKKQVGLDELNCSRISAHMPTSIEVLRTEASRERGKQLQTVLGITKPISAEGMNIMKAKYGWANLHKCSTCQQNLVIQHKGQNSIFTLKKLQRTLYHNIFGTTFLKTSSRTLKYNELFCIVLF